VLELGGKSAAIILPDADLAHASRSLHARYSRNAGQGCMSPTRILVQRSRLAEFLDLSREIVPKFKVGDPWDPETIAGPLISRQHRERVENYVARAVSAGANIVVGGDRPDLARGYYFNPTLVSNVDNDWEIAREELFGPVAVVLPYESVDEAISIANDSELGLAGAVFGPLAEAKKVARRLQAGNIAINGTGALRFDGALHGWKKSGLGVEYGEAGFLEFLHIQHIQWLVD
jgi:aldehyde dehydrogenase (NAD+)